MCECCPSPRTAPRTPEKEAAYQRTMARLGEFRDADLKRRGITIDQLLDPDCYGGPLASRPSKAIKFLKLAGLTVLIFWADCWIAYYKIRIRIQAVFKASPKAV